MEIALAIALGVALVLVFSAGIVLGLLFHGIRIYHVATDEQIPAPRFSFQSSDSDSAPSAKVISPFKREQTTFSEQ